MNNDLEQTILSKYPKMFNSYCRDFEHSDGWYNIVHGLCGTINAYITSRRANRANAMLFNRALIRANAGDTRWLVSYYIRQFYPVERTEESVRPYVERALEIGTFRKVPDRVDHVSVLQVKEKFGTLRFYYAGGDDTVAGMVSMAETMSACTCEVCGNPGKIRRTGWYQTLCDTHAGVQNDA